MSAFHHGRIVVVDDEESIRTLCERSLKSAGFEVDTANTGEEALSILASREIDFVLTDLAMPGGMSGGRLVEEIKHKYPLTDVVIMTAFPALETAIPALRSGAYDYLIKPFDQEFLKSVVVRCFERRRLSHDLSREKIMRMELEAAYRELQKVEVLKESFLSRINHELKSPLFPALLALDAIEPDLTKPRSRKLAQTIRSHLVLMQETVENLLLFANIEKSDFKRTRVGLRKILRSVVRKYRPCWEERQVKVEVSFEGSDALWSSSQLMETAFKHLLLNAIHFNKKGGVVRIQGRTEGDFLRVDFSDTGIGIPKDKTSKIFDSFYQVAEYLTREVGGLGLGLAIVRRIVEAHGGHVSVESREGEGTTFRLSFPRQVAPSHPKKPLLAAQNKP